MSSPDGRRREIRALRDRIRWLSTAILRITASLDVDTVLREVVESARALTGARYGAIATIDDGGQPREFVSSGVTRDLHELAPTGRRCSHTSGTFPDR